MSADTMAAPTVGSLESVRRDLNAFFYDREVPFAMALVRMALCLTLFVVIWPRSFHTREIYSTDGAVAQLADCYNVPNFLPEVNGTLAVALMTVLMVSFLTSAVGFCTRTSLIVSTILYSYFNLLDSVGTMTKYSVIATHVLLMLCFSRCGDVWSVDAWLKGTGRSFWPGESANSLPTSEKWPRRLIQLLIAIVYFGAAITKMHTPEFFTGDQLHTWMMTDLNARHPLGELVSLYPAALVAMCYIAIVWEIVFPFVCWKGWGRVTVLGLGAIFHFMTTLTLGLYVFPSVCFSIYLAFLEESEIRQIVAFLRKVARKLGALSVLQRLQNIVTTSLPRPQLSPASAQGVFAMAVLLIAVLGVEVEYRRDVYGERRPEGRHQLQTIDSQLVRTMLTPSPSLREKDKFYAVDLGTMTIAGHLADRRSEFHPGDRMIAQCHLTPPHDDMYIECNVVDQNNRLIDRLNYIATRDIYRVFFNYSIGKCQEPGEYQLVVKSAGQEVTRKKFRIASQDCPVPLGN